MQARNIIRAAVIFLGVGISIACADKEICRKTTENELRSLIVSSNSINTVEYLGKKEGIAYIKHKWIPPVGPDGTTWKEETLCISISDLGSHVNDKFMASNREYHGDKGK